MPRRFIRTKLRASQAELRTTFAQLVQLVVSGDSHARSYRPDCRTPEYSETTKDGGVSVDGLSDYGTVVSRWRANVVGVIVTDSISERA